MSTGILRVKKQNKTTLFSLVANSWGKEEEGIRRPNTAHVLVLGLGDDFT